MLLYLQRLIFEFLKLFCPFQTIHIDLLHDIK